MVQKHNTIGKNASKGSNMNVSKDSGKTAYRDYSLLIYLASILFIIATGGWFLFCKNDDLLFTAQGRSMFTFGSQMFNDCMQSPGGLLEYAGRFLTQFLYIPALGTAILVAMWIATFFLFKAALRVPAKWSSLLLVPIVCHLISIIDLGYWVYYLKEPGYVMRESLGLLVTSLLTLKCRWNENLRFNIAWMCVTGLTFPLFGYYSLLAILIMAVINKEKWQTWVCAAATIVFIPLVAYNIYTSTPLDMIWIAGFPVFKSEDVVSYMPMMPFVVSALSLILFAAIKLPEKPEGRKNMLPVVTGAAIAVVSLGTLIATDFDDKNFHKECRMYRAADEFRWEDVLSEMASLESDGTREMVILKNIALMNTDKIGEGLFHYNNMTILPHTYDSLHVHMVQTAAPLIYLHHGKTNFTYRWCIENAVEFDYNFYEMKVMTLASIINEEYDVANKYLTKLQNSIFYREWAEHFMPIIDGTKKAEEYPELAKIIELRNHMGSVLDGDKGLCEMYINNYFSRTQNVDSKYLAEVTLMYAILQKDIQIFWPHFFIYANQHQGENMPISYQEVAYLYGKLEPQTMDISRMPFDNDRIVERYSRFNQISQSLLQSGLTVEQVGVQMLPTFGDTFWWFYFFARDLHSY